MAPQSSPANTIITKIAPSARSSRYVVRKSLERQLDTVMERRLTLIHAPAGYGKTSLLTRWHDMLAERGVEVAWLTLEQEESDAARFAEYIMAAFASEGGVGESMPLRTALSVVVNRLSGEQRDTVLILDDFHRAQSDEVCNFMRNLIRLAPLTLHIVIASRDYPQLGQSVLSASEELLEIGIEALKFTSGEAQALLNQGAARPLSQDDVAKLVKRTEGWPIALRMTALSLRKGGDRADVIANFSGPSWELARYLSEQVLASLTPDIESIITRTAILDCVTGDLVNLLCDRNDGARVLERLEQQNLFLMPLDAQHESYRYHQTFAEILRDRLRRRDPAIFSQLHRAAATWFIGQGRAAEAVNHAVFASDEEFLATVLDGAGGWRMIPEGRMDTLVAGLSHLSLETITRFPRLALARIYHQMKQGEMDAARVSYDEFRNSAERTRLPANLRTEANLVGEVLSEYENAPVRLEDLLSKEALIRSLSSTDHLMLSNVYESLGAKYRDCGWLERALEPARQSRKHHRALGALYGEMFARFLEARIKLAQGCLDEAHTLLSEAAADIHRVYGPKSDLAANCAVYLAETLFERDDIEAAMALLGWALPHIEQSDGWFEIYASGFGTATRAALDGDPAEAPRIIERMRAVAGRRHWQQLQLLADIHEIEISIHSGQAELAWRRAETIELRKHAASMREEMPLYRQVALAASVCLAKLHLLTGDHEPALAEIQSTERWAHQHGHGQLLITLCILAAHALDLARRRDQAIARFDEAVNLSMFQGFIGPFLDCRRFVSATAIRDLRGYDAHKTDRFRKSFLQRLRKALERQPAQKRYATLLSEPELSTLKHLDRGYMNKEIALRMQVSPNTVKYRLKSLYKKLGVRTRKDAVRYCREQKLLDQAVSPPVGLR